MILAIIACNKGKVETIPHVSVKFFNTDIVPQGSTLRVTLDFTDREGDLDSIIVMRQRINARGQQYNRLPYGVPKFNGESRGELIVNLDYPFSLTLDLPALRIPGTNPARNEPDTLQLRFQLKDKAGHISDSTSPRQVIVIR